MALRSIRTGYKAATLVGICGALGSALVGVGFGTISFRTAMYFVSCVTLTAIVITRGAPTDLFDLGMIYGPDDEEAAVDDKGIWRKQALYVVIHPGRSCGSQCQR